MRSRCTVAIFLILLWTLPAMAAFDQDAAVEGLEKQGFKLKKTMSFSIRRAKADYTQVSGGDRENDLDLFGVRTEFALKLNERYRHAWFAGIGFTALKGELDQNLITGSGAGDVSSAFEFELFAESDYLINSRLALVSRGGLGFNIYNMKDVDDPANPGNPISNDDQQMEVFIGLGLEYALNGKSTIAMVTKFTLFDLFSSTDLAGHDVDYSIIGVQFNLSF